MLIWNSFFYYDKLFDIPLVSGENYYFSIAHSSINFFLLLSPAFMFIIVYKEHSPSCVDLLFTNQPNLARDSGIHPTLHSKCRHQIIFSKLNIQIEYPPLFTSEICDYNRDETDLTNHFIESFDWPKLFLGNAHQ